MQAPVVAVQNVLDDYLYCSSRVFFFSSRRRHTRFDCDWSSDVCSSDLYSSNYFRCELDNNIWRQRLFAHAMVLRLRCCTLRSYFFSDILLAVFCLRLIARSEEHTSELQSQSNLVCRLLLENKKILLASY